MNTRWIFVALLALGLGMALSTAHARCSNPWDLDCFDEMHLHPVEKEDPFPGPGPGPDWLDITDLNTLLIRTIEEQGTFPELREADSFLVIDMNKLEAYHWNIPEDRLSEAPLEVEVFQR